MTCPIQPLPQPKTLDQLKGMLEAIYQPLQGKTFTGSIVERNSSKVRTGGRRDVVQVYSQDTQQLMKAIVERVEEVSRCGKASR